MAPKYRQIADYLKTEIVAGRLSPGDKLGSMLELATRFDCAPETVRGAIVMLRIEGLVMTRHGLGVFVTEPQERRTPLENPDALPDSTMMLIMRLAEERDEHFAEFHAKLDLISQRLDALTG